MKTIEDLFFGKNIPFELPSLDMAERRRLIQLLDETEDPLVQTLTKEQRKMYEDCQNVHLDIAVADLRDAFVRGFRMGARLVMEVVAEEKG